MKIPFNKDNNGTDELVGLMGWMDADFKYEQLERNIVSAAREFHTMIGKALYNEVVELYFDDATELEEIELYKQLQLIILLDGYRHFVVNKDLSHTPTGRRSRVDEHEKMPFEWMLDRSNQGMERAYYKAIDEFLILVEDNETWIASPEYQLMHGTWVSSTAILKDSFPDASRFLLLKIASGLKRAQKKEIKSRLTPAQYKSINDVLIAGEDLTDESLLEVLELSRDIISLSGIHWGLMHLRVTIFPEGIAQPFTGDRVTTSGRQVPLGSQIERTALVFENDVKERCNELEQLLESLKPKEKQDLRLSGSHISTPTDKFFST